ncbi:MAG: dicarboxylate/amino acid:cation symporter [Terriglobales bacterium]
MYQRMRRKLAITALMLLTLTALAVARQSPAVAYLAVNTLAAARWLALLGLVGYACFRPSLTTWIFVSMLLGAEIGHDFPAFGVSLRLLAQIFLRLIKVIIAPLLFSTLVSGIAGHADLKKVGRMGVKALIFFEVVTTLALFIGLAAINLSQAGVGAQIPATPETGRVESLTLSQTLLHVFPENIAKSVAENQILQVVIFSLLFAIALALVEEAKRRPVLAFCESLAEVMFKFTNLVMWFAPLGILGAIAATVGSTGMGILGSLVRLLLTLYGALAVFLLAVLLPIALLAKVPIMRFIRALAEPATIAFSTASSEAALPSAMERMEEIGVSRPVVAFIMPTGYSFNLTGSALYLSLAAIFVAQAAGLHLTFGRQLYILLVLMLTSKGVAGVSRAAIVILLATAASVGLPTEPIFILLGIDQLMDMGRTAVNVIGNCLATVVIARWEGEFAENPATASARSS